MPTYFEYFIGLQFPLDLRQVPKKDSFLKKGFLGFFQPCHKIFVIFSALSQIFLRHFKFSKNFDFFKEIWILHIITQLHLTGQNSNEFGSPLGEKNSELSEHWKYRKIMVIRMFRALPIVAAYSQRKIKNNPLGEFIPIFFFKNTSASILQDRNGVVVQIFVASARWQRAIMAQSIFKNILFDNRMNLKLAGHRCGCLSAKQMGIIVCCY